MSASQLTKRTPVCILGAGVTGMSAAYHLSSKYRLLEAAAAVGGVASSFVIERYRFDRATVLQEQIELGHGLVLVAMRIVHACFDVAEEVARQRSCQAYS